jgi:hypothetical protein
LGEPRTITELVDAAVRRARAGWASESFALGLCAALVVDVAAIESRADWNAPATLAAAAIGGIACGTTWWLERSRDRSEIARRVDRHLAQNGALATAFELDTRETTFVPDAAAATFARLLASRALAALPERAVTRGVPAPSPAFLAAPMIAAAVLAFALERDPRLPRDLAELAGKISVQLSSASGSTPDDALAVERLHATAAQLENVAAQRRADPAELAAGLSQAERDLATLLAHAPPDAAARPELQAARDATSALLARLAETSARGSGSVGNAAETTGFGADGASKLANDAAPRTMSGPPRPAEPLGSPDVTAAPPTDIDQSPSPEPGTVAGRWWPTQYDQVVASWLSARAASQPQSR